MDYVPQTRVNSNMAGYRTREWLWLGVIIGIGVVLRASALATFTHAPESDELAYQSMALSLVHGSGIVDHMGNYALFNVGYPLFVLAPIFYLFGDDLNAARLFNLLLGIVAIGLSYLVAKEAGAGRLGRLVASAFWATYLPASVYGVYLFKENLMVPLMLGILWCALRLAKEPSLNISAGCGILFGMLALTGNSGLCLAAVVLFSLAVVPATSVRKVGLSLTIVIAAALITSPWIVRNIHVVGAPVLNTNGGFNLYLGNNPSANGWFISIADTPRGPTWQMLREEGELKASETLKQEAIEWIREHPTEFLTLAIRKAGYFWMPPFHEGKSQASTAENIVRILWGTQFVVIVAAALASLLIRRLRSRPVAMLWLAVGGYTAVHMVFYVIFRYREPIMPVLVVIAALAIEAVIVTGLAKNDSSYRLGS